MRFDTHRYKYYCGIDRVGAFVAWTDVAAVRT